jgi:hypothetical protein
VQSPRLSPRFVEGAEHRLGELVENPQQRLQGRIGLAAAVLPIAQGRHADAELLGELRLGKPSFRRMSRISNSGAGDWVGGANSGSSAIRRSISASVRRSNFSESKWPFSAFACRRVLRVIIKTSHPTGPASPK